MQEEHLTKQHHVWECQPMQMQSVHRVPPELFLARKVLLWQCKVNGVHPELNDVCGHPAVRPEVSLIIIQTNKLNIIGL